MTKTQLENVTELITDLESSLKNRIHEINNVDPTSASVSYLKSEIDRMNGRLVFLKEMQRSIMESGKTIYMFEFGSLDDIRQSFQNGDFNIHYIPEQLFTSISKQILNREFTPSKKIKMLNNLVKVFEEFKSKI
ncbi:hypothetical protein [Paenibacillus sp. FSL L8-0463]|uniref:hypothetical protein n=1 Tax=Paenibacillus sp. FSL L8-0463 TaxID=2954687 RepID=UPI00311A8B3C